METLPEQPQNQLEHQTSSQQPPAKTNFCATVTDVRINGEVHPVGSLRDRFGFSYDELSATRAEKDRRRSFCKIDGMALSVAEFEEQHPHITLGQE